MFERLPRELLWKIIENVPEAVFELRLVSKIFLLISNTHFRIHLINIAIFFVTFCEILT